MGMLTHAHDLICKPRYEYVSSHTISVQLLLTGTTETTLTQQNN